MSKSKSRKKKAPKRVPALPDLEHAKTAVLNSLTSASGQRTYEHAIREFVTWYCSEPRLAFNRTVVLRSPDSPRTTRICAGHDQSGFAALGLFLAALGIYGVITRLVTQRTNEIGVRMALGATFDQVLRLVLGAGVRMTLVGVGLGLLGAVALTRLLNAQLPGLATNNAVTISAAAVLLVAVSTAACYLPARRASKVDPLVAMRAE